ncbi:MAG: F0F1 ATP synthase subunit epsilon [Oceanococcaceae bacterium]
MKLHVDIVSAEGEIFSGPAAMVFAPAVQGEVGIAPRHAPLLTRLNPGPVRIRDESGADETIFVNGGFLEVLPHHVTVMADSAERAADLDESRAIEAKRRAEEALSNANADIDLARAQAELAEAAARLHLIKKLKRR